MRTASHRLAPGVGAARHGADRASRRVPRRRGRRRRWLVVSHAVSVGGADDRHRARTRRALAPPVVRPPRHRRSRLARAIDVAHRDAEQMAKTAEASLMMAMRHLIRRPCGSRRHYRTGRGIRRPGAFRQLCRCHRADLTAPLDLRQLAELAGVTRFQVIRDFKRITGLTPGAYLRNRRLRPPRHLIRQGATAAEAAATGFADQSHLSRTFEVSTASRRRYCPRAGMNRSVQHDNERALLLRRHPV